jgi:hypothetical protein
MTKDARVGPAKPASRKHTTSGKVSGTRPKPCVSSSNGSRASHAPANARTKKAINGCRVINRLSGEDLADCDVVVMVDMLCVLSLQESPAL